MAWYSSDLNIIENVCMMMKQRVFVYTKWLANRLAVVQFQLLADRQSRVTCHMSDESWFLNIVTMAAVTDSLFYVGQKFSCFNDLENCQNEYEMSMVTFVI